VTLEELGAINVIHGPNNVGKSNLLRAIEVFFRLLTIIARAGCPSARRVTAPRRTCERGHPPS